MTPGSPEWLRVVTASKVAAILGLSPWDSPRSLWHKMRGDVPSDAGNDATRRGHYLEPAILAWWRDQHQVSDPLEEWHEQPTYLLGDWAAATPDAVALLCDDAEGWERVLVEAKSTAQEWDELPAYYLTQVIWQMHVSGVHRCYVPVIGPRLTFTEYVVDYADHTEDAALIEMRCREFWESLDTETPPPLDDTVPTYEAVRRVHPDIERGECVELDYETASTLVVCKGDLDHLEKVVRGTKSRVLEQMQRAQYATHNGVRIARRQPRGDDVSFVVLAKPTDLILAKESA